jgi:hypothetical protein
LLTTSGLASVGLLYKESVGSIMSEAQFIEAVGLFYYYSNRFPPELHGFSKNLLRFYTFASLR